MLVIQVIEIQEGFQARFRFVTDVSTTMFDHATELRALQLQKAHLHYGRFLVPLGKKWYACQIFPCSDYLFTRSEHG